MKQGWEVQELHSIPSPVLSTYEKNSHIVEVSDKISQFSVIAGKMESITEKENMTKTK